MVCTVAAGTASGYYLSEQARYYTDGKESIGQWYAPTGTMGVTDGAEIDDGQFERLHSGLDAVGRPLTQNADGTHANRVAGYDLTFSAPKSVSVLWALELGDQRDALAAAHDAAVRRALDMISENATFARRGKGGERLEAVALTGAIFRHGESRPTGQSEGQIEADPQLHSHAVLFNLAQREDLSWGSIDGRQLYRWKMAAGAVYRAELASQLQSLGYRIDRTDEKGLFEVAGVPQAVRDEFSGRRREIVAALKEMGLDTAAAPALAAAVTKAGRRGKSLEVDVDRHARWAERAEAIGHQPVAPMAETSAPSRTVFDPSALLERLTENLSVFRRPDVVARVAADLTGGGLGAAVVPERVEAVLKSSEVVPLGTDAIGLPIFSTKAMIVLEQDVIGHAKAMATAPFSAMPATRPVPTLSEEQNAAVTHALQPHRLVVIEGAAGSGKTTTMGVIADIHRESGCRVIGAATAWRAAKQLGEECRIESRALDSWLAKHRDGQKVFDGKTVMIIDESSQLSTRQMHTLLSAARDTGAKVILTGDKRQMQAVGAGSGLALVAAEVAATRIDTNRRQHDAWAREAVSQLSRGQSAPALHAFDRHGWLHWAGGRQEALDAVVGLWRQQIDQHGGSGPLVIAKSNADVRDLNAILRRELRAMGKVSGQDVTILAVDRSRATVDLALAKGDRIEFTLRNDDLGVINGTTGTVTRVEPETTGRARLTVAIGSRTVCFSTADITDGRGRARISHAIATTLFNSQGMTVERAIVLGATTLTANQAYVAASRARTRTDIVIDDKAVDSELRARGRAAGHLRTSPFSMEERRAHLAGQWARREVKETARDFARHAPSPESGQRRAQAMDPDR